MDEIKLKPCPFCGYLKARLVGSALLNYFILCADCGAFATCKITEQEAIEAWNRRAGECANNATAAPAKRD